LTRRLLCQIIQEHRVPPASIGVITFYRAQVALLKSMLTGEEGAVQVATVDSFQGRENDVILLSLVRTEGAGFLADYRRLNVALTRAKHCLLLLGHAQALASADSSFSHLVRSLEQQKRVVVPSIGAKR